MSLGDKSSTRRRSVADLVGDVTPETPAKNKGGRPRKHPLPDPSIPKRKVGRPPKITPSPKKAAAAKPDAVIVPIEPVDDDHASVLDSHDVSSMLLHGVSVQQLARLFRMTRALVDRNVPVGTAF